MRWYISSWYYLSGEGETERFEEFGLYGKNTNYSNGRSCLQCKNREISTWCATVIGGSFRSVPVLCLCPQSASGQLKCCFDQNTGEANPSQHSYKKVSNLFDYFFLQEAHLDHED